MGPKINLPPDTQPWYLTESHLHVVAQAQRAAGTTMAEAADPEGAEQMAATPEAQEGVDAGGGVLVLPVRGPIFPRTTRFMQAVGMAGLDVLRDRLRAAVANQDVRAIVLDIESPGGIAEGLGETAALLRKLRQEKPIIAVANTLAASAAYYIAANAGEVVAAPDSFTGSIGTIMVHASMARFWEEAGVDITVIRNPARKAEGSFLEPLSEQAQARFQEVVDIYTTRFQADVAKGRSVSMQTVRQNFGQGTVLMEHEALAAGMVDRVESLDAVLQRAGRGGRKARPRSDGALVLVEDEETGAALPAADTSATLAAMPLALSEPEPAAGTSDAAERERLRRLQLGG